MNYQIRFTETARADLKRLYACLLERDVQAANAALDAIKKAMQLLKAFPFTCRKAVADNPFLRELVTSFGVNGYVALFEIEENEIVTILAVRHSREEDYR